MASEQSAHATLLGQYAGFFTRLIAYAIDRFIVAAILAVVGIAVTWILTTLGLTEWITTPGWLQTVVFLLLFVLGVAIRLLYTMGFWVLAGQTPGKRVMGVRIVRTDGGRVGWGNAIRREIGYVISYVLFLGYLWILVDNRRQGWHDKLAGTLVIYSWPKDGGTPARDRLSRFRERRMASQGSAE
jgi:uncharacterized RDD family membrane protein YckC